MSLILQVKKSQVYKVGNWSQMKQDRAGKTPKSVQKPARYICKKGHKQGISKSKTGGKEQEYVSKGQAARLTLPGALGNQEAEVQCLTSLGAQVEHTPRAKRHRI